MHRRHSRLRWQSWQFPPRWLLIARMQSVQCAADRRTTVDRIRRCGLRTRDRGGVEDEVATSMKDECKRAGDDALDSRPRIIHQQQHNLCQYFKPIVTSPIICLERCRPRRSSHVRSCSCAHGRRTPGAVRTAALDDRHRSRNRTVHRRVAAEAHNRLEGMDGNAPAAKDQTSGPECSQQSNGGTQLRIRPMECRNAFERTRAAKEDNLTEMQQPIRLTQRKEEMCIRAVLVELECTEAVSSAFQGQPRPRR
jgi:hypothetical protein